MRVLPLLAVAGCSTLATLHGARTLEPGEVEVGVAMSVQHGANPLGAALPFVPQLEFAGRYGVTDDFDLGMRAYLLGGGMDARYRFWRNEKFDLAAAPGLDLFYLPTIGGSAELRAPVLGEVQLGEHFALSGGPAMLLRDQWNRVHLGSASGLQSRMDVFAGGGGRWEFHGNPVVFGISADFFAQPARAAGLAWSAGMDLGLRNKKTPRPEPQPDAPSQDTGASRD